MSTIKFVEYVVICDGCSTTPGQEPHQSTIELAQHEARLHGWTSADVVSRARVPLSSPWVCPDCTREGW